jgi:hypothetical protein
MLDRAKFEASDGNVDRARELYNKALEFSHDMLNSQTQAGLDRQLCRLAIRILSVPKIWLARSVIHGRIAALVQTLPNLVVSMIT